MKPFTTDAFSRIMSSFRDRFLLDTGSVSRRMCAGDATLSVWALPSAITAELLAAVIGGWCPDCDGEELL